MSRLLFRGFKTFWKTKSFINIIIIEHAAHGIYEIIAYDPVLCQHTPRLYINAYAVHVSMNTGSNKSTRREERAIVDGAVTKFLFNRIALIEYLPISKVIKIDVKTIYYYERSVIHYTLVVDCPEDLPLYASPFDTQQW